MKKIVLTLLFTLGLVGNVAADSACCNENYGFYAGVTGGANWLNFKKHKIHTTDVAEIVITETVVTTETVSTTEVVAEVQPAVEQASEAAAEVVAVADVEDAAIVKAMANDVDPSAPTVKAKRKNKLGWTIGAVAGYRFCPFDVACGFAVAPRVEGEISYRSNSSSGTEFEVDAGNVSAVATFKDHTKIQTMAYMANVIVDMDFDFPVSPYIGGGIGYAHSWGKHATESRFAYQGIAGFSYAFCYGIELSVDYRYLVAIKDSNAQAVTVGLKKFF